LAFGKFGWHYGISVVLDNDAPRQKLLGQQKLFDGTGKIRRHGLSVGDYGAGIHGRIGEDLRKRLRITVRMR